MATSGTLTGMKMNVRFFKEHLNDLLTLQNHPAKGDG